MSFYQMKILQHMSGFLKPNGILVYSTCSLEYQENWNVISSFLKLNSNYKLESAESFVPKKWINEQNCFETFPPGWKSFKAILFIYPFLWNKAFCRFKFIIRIQFKKRADYIPILLILKRAS